ncbi:MAG: Ornithine carbamoyltransferase [bacterium ADurb.Bin431]|nr:MAG: Ornithine carbamoyltransferase [bacterium ADurb.Bin431]HOH07497.1 ornithine carbamoyltransferase [bacterium]HOY45272.1 ornithine carbamoyltransferase [bacterium]HPG83637.1 ornithine carbamoyltransferase [bacterium]HPM60610.1 ornithine carbamoyltransferase [bacterium]
MKRDFLAETDFSKKEIIETFKLARKLKKKVKKGEKHHLLRGKVLGMIFQKPSNRTRVSFEVGMYQLGGHAIYLGPAEIGLGTRESVADVARVLARFTNGIMARVFGHDLVEGLAQWAPVPVINGLSDLLHPCQILGDLLTIIEHKGTFEGVRIAYVGDGNNIVNSFINVAGILPLDLRVACPKGYEPNAEILAAARAKAVSKIEVMRDPVEAVNGADVIYTDTWASMGQEAEAEARRKVFKRYQVNSKLLEHAARDYIFMHCLPAHRGEEVTDEVMDGPHSVVFDEAENRLHIQKAIMVKLMA